MWCAHDFHKRIISFGTDYHSMSEQDATVLEARKRIEEINDEIRRYGIMYLFLIAGEVSEVFGKYAPLSSDAVQVNMDIGWSY